jgi:hypothetical protein
VTEKQQQKTFKKIKNAQIGFNVIKKAPTTEQLINFLLLFSLRCTKRLFTERKLKAAAAGRQRKKSAESK